MQAQCAEQNAIDETVYRLYVLSNARQGMQDIDAGRVISSEELAKEIEQW